MIEVRPATPLDIAALDALFARSYGALLRRHYPPSALVLALPRLARAQPRLLASGHYFVAEVPDRIVGAGGWSPEPPGGTVRPTTELGHVRHVATDAAWVRRAIGRAVLEAVLDDAACSGLRRLRCLSTLNAVPFYRAMGFAPLRRVELRFGAPVSFPALEMERPL